MIKHFCDWCEAEILPQDNWVPSPLESEGEICQPCFTLMKSAFAGKHVVKVTTLDFHGITYEHVRSTGKRP